MFGGSNLEEPGDLCEISVVDVDRNSGGTCGEVVETW